MKRTTWPKITGVAIVVILMALPGPRNEAVRIITQFDPISMVAYIQSFGAWAPIISTLLMILQALVAPLPLPSVVIAAANAILFGWWQGALLSWAGSMIGAILCFYIARGYGQPIANRLVGRGNLDRVQGFMDRYGSHTVLVARLLPVVPFDVMSYAAGLTGMRFWDFFWATGLGQTPAALVYSYLVHVLGDRLMGGAQISVPPLFWIATSATAILIAGLAVAQYLARNKARRASASGVPCRETL